MATVRVGDLDMSYQLQGCGPVLMLVAGTGYPSATWWPAMVDDLSQNYAVLTYDHRGTGSTTSTPGPYSTRMFAHDALGLLEALDIPSAHVLGHSMGGRVAQWMALDGAAQTEGVILAASGPGPLPGSQRHTLGIPTRAAAAMVELGYCEYVRRTQRETFFTDKFCEQNPETVDWLATAFWSHRPTVLDYFEHVSARQQHDTVARLGDIGQPVLVMVGDQDTHRRGTGSHFEQSEYLAAALPRAEMVVLPGVRHGFFWETPEASTRCIRDWLSRTFSQSAGQGEAAGSPA